MGLSTEEEYVEHARHADEVGESESEEVYDEYGRDSDEYSDEFREVAYRGGADYANDDDEDEDDEGMLMARGGTLTDDEEGNDDDGEDFASGACDEDENDDYHGEDEDEDEDSEGTGDSGSTSGCEVLLPHLDSKEEVENTHSFAERRTRLAVAGQSVGAHLVSFSLNHDARKDPPLENTCPHKLFFKIDGASSNCVRNAWKRAGFERTNKGGWNLWWGRPLKFPEHKKLNEYQKVCHFPGTYYLGRKDNLARNVAKFKRNNGPSSYPYLPVTYVLPDDHMRLLQDWRDRGEKDVYIVKPKAGARGVGIRLVAKPDVQIKKGAACLVQRYIDNPLLIDGRKFDLRVYVLVTSFDPLRVYVFKEGLARFCSQQYSEGSSVRKNYKDKLRHLTNYSLNKKSADVEEDADGQGIKWSFSTLRERLAQLGHDPNKIWGRINDLVIRTLIAVEEKINMNMNMYVPHKGNCYELFGFDVMLDRTLHPWIIEVNTSPSLATEWQLDKKIKNQLSVDIFNLLGVCGYSRVCMKSRGELPKPPGTDRMRKMEVATGRRDALENLSEWDAADLLEWDAELSHAGSFERIFPAPGTASYLPLFASQRYNNVLLCAWANTPPSHRPSLARIASNQRSATAPMGVARPRNPATATATATATGTGGVAATTGSYLSSLRSQTAAVCASRGGVGGGAGSKSAVGKVVTGKGFGGGAGGKTKASGKVKKAAGSVTGLAKGVKAMTVGGYAAPRKRAEGVLVSGVGSASRTQAAARPAGGGTGKGPAIGSMNGAAHSLLQEFVSSASRTR